MTTQPVLPVVTIAGYLGAGKTTLINHLLRHADGRRLAILVNEFGALAIDHDLIEAEEDTLISITGGCICCSFGDDLIGALKNLETLTPRPDCVVIESSGVALPGAIVSTLALVSGFRSDGIVVVIDAETIQAAYEDEYIADTIRCQLDEADIIVSNKLDLVTEAKQAELKSWLDDISPQSIKIPAKQGRVPLQAILGQALLPSSSFPKHDHNAEALFESMVLMPSPQTAPTDLAQKLVLGNTGIIRAKGHFTASDGQCWLIQIVGKRWDVEPAKPQPTGIVCIGLSGKLDCTALQKLE